VPGIGGAGAVGPGCSGEFGSWLNHIRRLEQMADQSLPQPDDVRRNELGQPIGDAVPGWMPPPPPARCRLEGRWCSVEPLEVEAHGAALWEMFALDTDGRDWTYLSQEPFAQRDDFMAWAAEAARSRDPLFFAIVDETGCATGVASYLRIAPAAGSIEVGHIHLSPRLQRTAAATEAMFLMMRYAFSLGYRRYEWKCDALNGPSRTAAARLGFTFEGIFRQALVYKGRNRDTAWYSIIDREWAALAPAYEAWLSPQNFDATGAQRARLSDLVSSARIARSRA
jgi:RimJ/RimL family protein N-acetyltransferase